jgi:hypothetical protein
LSGRRETISLLANKVPALSNKWFSDKGICIMVLEMGDWLAAGDGLGVMVGAVWTM